MQAQANLLERLTQTYVAYRSVRLLSVLAVLLCVPLLFVLAGGFPPTPWRLLAQALPQLSVLLAAHGPAVLLALFGELLLSVTLLLAWGGLFWLSWKMLAYWLYERRELLSFAADVEEAQYQAEGVEEQYEAEEDFTVERVETRQSYPPRARRRVIYPLNPPIPDDDSEEEGTYSRSEEEFFEPDEEIDEEEMALYRDEDEEEEMDWTEQQAVGTAMPVQPASFAGTQAYKQAVSPLPASASGARADNIQHSSYGRILPFSVAPSAGALPHLTTTLYDRVPLPHSVSADPITPQAAPPPTAPARAVPPISPLPAQPALQAGAPVQNSSSRPAKIQPPVRSAAPASSALKPVAPQRPTAIRAVPARPTAKGSAPSVPARPTVKLIASPQELEQPAIASRLQPIAPAIQPSIPAEKPTALQSLVELISTVPLNPSTQASLPLAPTGVTAYPNAPAQAFPPLMTTETTISQNTSAQASIVPAEGIVSETTQVQAINSPVSAQVVEYSPAPIQSPISPMPAETAGSKPDVRKPAMQSLTELISTVPLGPQPRSPIPIARPIAKPEAGQRRPTTQLVVGTGLDVGLKRRGRPNEDSLLALHNTRLLRGNSCPVGLFVVADGMGGHENGQEASHTVVQSLSKTVVPSVIYGPTDDNYAELLVEGVHRANLEIYQRNRQAKVDMGTTIVAALVIDSTAYIVSAGDSRVYLYRAASGLSQITRDHSTVARLVENGLIKPEEIYTHPRRNEIYRSLGHHPSEDLDKFILALQPDDVLMLCSDGLWEMVRDEHMQEIIASTATQPEQTSAALVQAALDGGGKDNISVIVVHIRASEGTQTAWAG